MAIRLGKKKEMVGGDCQFFLGNWNKIYSAVGTGLPDWIERIEQVE